MGQAVRFGPMGEQVRGIEAVLRDPKICQYHVVAIPEELPVVEGIELAQNIQNATGQKPKIIFNKILSIQSKDLKSDGGELESFRAHLKSVDETQKAMIDRLQASGFDFQELPWILKIDPKDIVSGLAKELKL